MEIKDETTKNKIKKIIIEKKIVKPEHADALADDMLIWYYEHRRDMKMNELNKLIKPYL